MRTKTGPVDLNVSIMMSLMPDSSTHYSPGQETSLDDNIHGKSLERREEKQAALKREAVKVSMKLVESFIQRPIPRIL